MMPWKTILTAALFTVAVVSLKVFDPTTIPLVWKLPLPPPPVMDVAPVKPRIQIIGGVEVPNAETTQSPAYSQLADPTHELDHFFSALSKGSATVIHYGDSPTTADLITADARVMLQKQFGDAGSGFVLIARPWAWYGHRGVEMDASNWKIDVAGVPNADLKDGLHGLGAASFRGSQGAVAHWTIKDAQHTSVEISFLLQPDGGSFSMEADGMPLGSADTAGEPGPGYASFTFPPSSKEFTLRVTKGSVRLYGAYFRKPGPGIIYSSVGINGANITLLSHAMNGPHWEAQLRHYHPDLVVVAFGTNESSAPTFVDGPWAAEMKNAVHRIQAAVPGVSVLLMSPMDRGERKENGDIGTVDALPRLVGIESKDAAELGVAFFNTYQAMGGEGTMGKWYNGEPRMVAADFTHPMPAGAKIVGGLLYDALRDGYNDYKLRQLKDAETRVETGASSKTEPSNQTQPAN